jgi:3-hydroxymyristoyl/3-hydroxydecanoyl-(acyl carrier protein) dehydratase
VSNADFVLTVTDRSAEQARLHVHVPRELKYLDGHFPGQPIVPGVAQLVLIERAIASVWPELHTPAGIRRLKFQARIDPGVDVDVLLAREERTVSFQIVHGETETSRGALVF